MNKSYLLNLIILVILLNLGVVQAQKESQEYYQLKIYNLESEEQLHTTSKYLKHAWIPALHKNNVNNIGVFKPRQEKGTDTQKQIYVLIPLSSIEHLEILNEELQKDKTYLEKGDKYLNASHENPPYERIQTILLKAFKNMPILKPSPLKDLREDRIYELRSYQSPTESLYQKKVEMFNEGGEIELFQDLGFNAVFYGEVISGPDMPNLMYMTSFKNQESRDAHWEKFRNAPAWKEMSSIPKYQNTVSHINITFLYPTEYSDY